MSFFVVRPNSVILPRDFSEFREPPRPLHLRGANYADEFDWFTVFYDIFSSGGGKVYLSGPPLLNLKHWVDAGCRVGGELIPPDRVHWLDNDKFQRSWIDAPGLGAEISFDALPSSCATIVGATMNEVFKGRQVLLTLSKDNKLQWVFDWVDFHVKVHRVNAVLFYDNGSNAYTVEEVLDTLRQVQGLESACVVSWNFPYGPQGARFSGFTDAPWDSDFAQYAMLEHARLRFLADAAGVINADVDELLLCDGGLGVFDYLREHGLAGAMYKGRWIEKVTPVELPTTAIRHRNYFHYDPNRKACTAKWTILPASLSANVTWQVHGVGGAGLSFVEGIRHRHFMAISTDWKMTRSVPKVWDSSVFVGDDLLKQVFDRVWPL